MWCLWLTFFQFSTVNVFRNRRIVGWLSSLCTEEPSGEADNIEMEAEVAVGEKRAPAMSTAPPKRARAARKLQILTQAPGTEAGSEGVMRTVEQQARRPGLFSASNYFWL